MCWLFSIVIVSGKDLIGLAQTGSGKTGAFALPILQALLDTPQVLFACVLSPTRFVIRFMWLILKIVFSSKNVFHLINDSIFVVCHHPPPFSRELAIQIAEQFEALGSGIGLKCAVVSFLFN